MSKKSKRNRQYTAIENHANEAGSTHVVEIESGAELTEATDVGTSETIDRDVCTTEGCGGRRALIYLDKPMCQRCWDQHCTAEPQAATTQTTPTDDLPPEPTDSIPAECTPVPPPPAAATPKALKPKRISALDAAAQILAERQCAMNTTELVATMADSGLWESPVGKTPAATLYAAIFREIGKAVDSGGNVISRFRKIDRGRFAFNEASR